MGNARYTQFDKIILNMYGCVLRRPLQHHAGEQGLHQVKVACHSIRHSAKIRIGYKSRLIGFTAQITSSFLQATVYFNFGDKIC